MLLIVAACNDDEETMVDPNAITVWSGATITFEKADDADPTIAANQDRISSNVWLTRGNNGGQIYNVVSENSSSKADSPAGTLWAQGTTANLDNLSFANFRSTIQPQQVVGKDLVLLLVDENIAIDIKFTSWSQNKNGGFAYERSTN